MNAELLYSPLIALPPERQSKVAFQTESERITYAELSTAAAKGAAWLSEQGCVRGDRIAICLPKGFDSVKLIFSVLMAGAIVVPVDPYSPALRVQRILFDLGVQRLFTTQRMADSQDSRDVDAAITVTESFNQLVAGVKGEFIVADQDSNDTALIYFTSGTTSEPKAIMLSHRNVSAFASWAVSEFELNEIDRVVSHAPYHFDLSTLDLFAATRVYATVVILDEASIKFPSKVSKLIETLKISVWYSVPTALVQLLNYGALHRRDMQSLRLVLYAGEVFPIEPLIRLMEMLPKCEFVNLYGPTETNVCTCYRLSAIPEPGVNDIPIGKACEYAHIKLCNKDGSDTPKGEVGEIIVNGASVMRGYWGQPEMTSRSRQNADVESYKTGDLAYMDDQGDYHLLGRIDDQIKIRGYRVELSEVVATLAVGPQVMEAAALLSEPQSGEAEIVAFVVPAKGDVISEEELLDHCTKRMPQYAVPGRIICLGSLPRTSTGKVDRQALKQNLLVNDGKAV